MGLEKFSSPFFIFSTSRIRLAVEKREKTEASGIPPYDRSPIARAKKQEKQKSRFHEREKTERPGGHPLRSFAASASKAVRNIEKPITRSKKTRRLKTRANGLEFTLKPIARKQKNREFRKKFSVFFYFLLMWYLDSVPFRIRLMFERCFVMMINAKITAKTQEVIT